MEVVTNNAKTHSYQCPECHSIIKIQDNEFRITKKNLPFPHLMGLEDFKKDTRIKVRICDCPVCGATIEKERDRWTKKI